MNAASLATPSVATHNACMRVARGRVVGNTVVLEEPLPEGASVTVVAGEDEPWELDEASTAELLAAAAAADRGELSDFAAILAKLPPVA